ncbi:MAG: isoleucine--tRNA ligase [Bacilli bacterium]|nr:isoleucine--tRNA ligase [Bacilli bacterium]
MDYKDTLLMMKTDFNMKANLPNKEPEIEKKWEDINLYKKVLDKNEGNVPFVLHDGPPYANGSIHEGHALNKILKDFIVRYKTMKGFFTPYIPGWDTHGLPIETALTKNSKINRKELSIVEFRKLCEEYALKQVETQKIQFKRLGILGRWDNPYVTLDKNYEAMQIKVFAKMVEKNLIFKGLKPVYWSPSSESALAEAEIEYYDKNSNSIYVAFKVVDPKSVLPSNSELLIWTTTPWTIPANLAISVHPKFEYAVIKTDSGRILVIGCDLLESATNKIGIRKYEIIKKVCGSDLEYITYKHSLNKRVGIVILGEHVTKESGTGLVHTAPGHGEDDFVVGKTYNLEVLCPVDSKGYMTEESLGYEGMFYEVANQKVIEDLKDCNSLLFTETITHSYPHDWRTRKPVIFRATDQWFASIESLKETLLESIKNVEWLPKWGELRISNMIKDRKEWCISRQRVWGVPIPVFYAEDNTPILDKEIINHVSEIFKKEGSSIWYEKEAKDLLPKGYSNPHSPNGIFTKETDTMDVWFDSGSSSQSVLVEQNIGYPADLYIEGSDQYRGWFNSSLIVSVALNGIAPYKATITHGFVLDGQGRKMSKSLGNSVSPELICNQFGADILRLWASSVEYTSDVRISKELIQQTAEAYRKIRNTFRFLLGNLFDYNDLVDKIDYYKMPEIDQFMMCKLNIVVEKVILAYDRYEFNEVFRLISSFVSNELSAFYLDFAKDILYIEKFDNFERRSIQTVLYKTLDNLIKLLTPIIPHTTEEVLSYMNNVNIESSYLLNMPDINEYNNQKDLVKKYSDFMRVRDDILKALENARNNKIIGKSMSAKIIMKPSKATLDLFNSIKVNLKSVFIVSEFVLTNEKINGEEYDSGIILVTAREGIICDRCWQVVDDVNEKGLCERCNKVVESLEGK